MKSLRCFVFRHIWSKDVYIPWSSGSITVKVCLHCERIVKSRMHIMSINEIDPERLKNAVKEALAQGRAT